VADGIYYRDTRQPFTIADLGNITLAATQKCLWTPGATSPTQLPVNYWTVGKVVKLTAGLKWTSGTAGNITIGACYGTADAPGAIVTSATHAAVASVGPFLVYAQAYFQCRSVGTAGTLSMWGMAHFPIDLMLSTTGMDMGFPSAGATVVSTIDTTVVGGPYFTASRSAGTDTVAAVGLVMEALN
jgi:hypothetical protein